MAAYYGGLVTLTAVAAAAAEEEEEEEEEEEVVVVVVEEEAARAMRVSSWFDSDETWDETWVPRHQMQSLWRMGGSREVPPKPSPTPST